MEDKRQNKEELTRREFFGRLSTAALTAFLFVISSGKDSSASTTNDLTANNNVCYTNIGLCYQNCYTNSCYTNSCYSSDCYLNCH